MKSRTLALPFTTKKQRITRDQQKANGRKQASILKAKSLIIFAFNFPPYQLILTH
jgi:hypothetical protein